MLTKEDFDLNFLILEILSGLNAFPFLVERKEGKILQQPSKWRRGFWFALYLYTFLHGVHSSLRLVQSLIFPQYFTLYNFAVHSLAVLMDIAILIVSFFSVIQVPEVTVAIFNEFFRGAGGEIRDLE
jgi:hypothetical protein